MLAAFTGRFTYPTHEARHFRLDIDSVSPVRVQLNHGDPANDETRLARIAEFLLVNPQSPRDPGSAIPNPQSGGEA